MTHKWLSQYDLDVVFPEKEVIDAKRKPKNVLQFYLKDTAITFICLLKAVGMLHWNCIHCYDQTVFGAC